MSSRVRPHPITMHDKTTNIYLLVTFRTDSWRRPWGGHRAFMLLVIGWPTFPPSSSWRARAILFALARWRFLLSHLLGCGSSYLLAALDFSLQESGLHCRPARHTAPPRGGACPGIHRRRSALHRPRAIQRPQRRYTRASPRAHAELKPHGE